MSSSNDVHQSVPYSMMTTEQTVVKSGEPNNEGIVEEPQQKLGMGIDINED